MKSLGYLLVTLALACVLAAVWLPGQWWQWLTTAVIVFVAGAFFIGDRK